MSALLCCRRAPAPASAARARSPPLAPLAPDMGAALSQPHHHQHQVDEECAAGPQPAPATMAELIRERKKKSGGAGLGTLRRRIAAAAVRRARDHRPDRGCEHARQLRAVVGTWRVCEVAALRDELEAGAALRDLATQAELAREPAPHLHAALAALHKDMWGCDAVLLHRGVLFPVHRAVLSARCAYFRDLLNTRPDANGRHRVEGAGAMLAVEELEALLATIYGGVEYARRAGAGRACDACSRQNACPMCTKSVGAECGCSEGECCARAPDLDVIGADRQNGTGGRGARGGCACLRRRRVDEATLARLADDFGFRADALHADMKYLLDSGEYADARLVFSWEAAGPGGAAGVGGQSATFSSSEYGFRAALELPCHRALLAARSRFFRNVLSRRGGEGACAWRCAGAGGAGGGGGVSGAAANAGSAARVCVDEKVLPRRFARALLHAAYTDQLDLSLIPRGGQSATSAGATGWVGGRGGNGGATGTGGKTSSWGRAHAQLEDAFQLYEIARFVEMPLVVQRCEDAIVEALSPDSLPHVLRWSAAPHASAWVHRQTMRYLRDEFAVLCARGSVARLPRPALAEALASPFLQASEPQALRALLAWGEHHAQRDHHAREPNVVWHTAHSVTRRVGGGAGGAAGGGGAGGRRRAGDVSDAALREAIAPLVHHLRLEHVPPDNELMLQAVRRGLVASPPAQMVEGAGGSVDAWLGRPPHRAPRLFLPHLDELRALLAGQSVPAADVARVRRQRYLHRIPDTLYMVQAERGAGDGAAAAGVGGGGGGAGAAGRGAEGACLSPRVLRRLRSRVRELRSAPPAARALAHHAADAKLITTQIALRAVREMSLPDACAELLGDACDDDRAPPPVSDASDAARSRRERDPWGNGADTDSDAEGAGSLAGAGGAGGGGGAGGAGRSDSAEPWDELSSDEECCRYRTHAVSRGGGSGSVDTRSMSAGSLRSVRALHLTLEGERAPSACRRRELPALLADGLPHRYSPASGALLGGAGAGAAGGSGAGAAGRLSSAVPDVAMAPDANMHLLAAPDYFRQRLSAAAAPPPPPPLPLPLPVTAAARQALRDYTVGGGMLQLDLGDGATHTPRPGSRAQRAASRLSRDLQQQPHAHAQVSTSRGRVPAAGGGAGGADDDLRAALEMSLLRAYSAYHPRSLSPSLGSGGGGGGEVRPSRHLLHAEQAATLPHPAAYRPLPQSAAATAALPAHAHASPGSTMSLRSVGGGAALALGGAGAGPGAGERLQATRAPSRLDYAHYARHRTPDYRAEYAVAGSSSSREPSPSSYA